MVKKYNCTIRFYLIIIMDGWINDVTDDMFVRLIIKLNIFLILVTAFTV